VDAAVGQDIPERALGVVGCGETDNGYFAAEMAPLGYKV
jgi:hypothetical protein